MVEDEAQEIDYASMSKDELFEAIGEAYKAKELKLMGKLTSLYDKLEKAEAKEKKDALLAALVETTQTARKAIKGFIDGMEKDGLLEGAEGVWFAWDFGAVEEVGINPACRLIKTGSKKADGSPAKSSYVANPAKSSDMLEEVGDDVLFEEDTEVQINKEAHTVPAGMTYKQAYDYSTNGGWRNRIRMALLKATGKI